MSAITEISPVRADAPDAPDAPVAPARPERRAGRLPRRAAGAGLALLGGVVLVAAWQLVVTRAPDAPSPAETARALAHLLARPFYDGGPNDKGIGLQLLHSLRRVFSGFALAAAVGVPAGLVLAANRHCWRMFNPVVQLLRPVSPLAWFPIWLVVFRDAARAAVFVIFITALWPTLLNTAAGAQSVPRDHRNVARVFRFSRFAYVRHVLVPHVLPDVVTGLRLSMGLAWVVIVAVEMLSGGTGVGFFVWDAYNAANLPGVAAGILVIGVVGIGLDLAFLQLQRRVAIEEVAE